MKEKELREKGFVYKSAEYRKFGNCCYCNGVFEAPTSETFIHPKTGEEVTLEYNPLWGECSSCGGL